MRIKKMEMEMERDERMVPKREMESSWKAGTWPKGWSLRKSGDLC